MKDNNKLSQFMSGFTLVELLVVISIIALLLGILMPALGRARNMAKELVCMSQMRSLAQAAQLYANDNENYIPLGGSRDSSGNLVSGYPVSHYWDVRLLSYLGATNLNLKDIPTGVFTPDPEGLKSYAKTLEIFVCPSVRSSQRNEIKAIQELYKYPRSYAINLNVAGLVTNVNGDMDVSSSYKTGSKVSNISRASETLLFIDRRIHDGSGVNVLYGLGVRKWFDIYPSHNVKVEPGDDRWNPWRFPTAYGSSGFAFVDGHVKNLKCQFTKYVADVTSVDNPDRIPGVKLSENYKW